jgi:putative peptidoglycan lipid II flippase
VTDRRPPPETGLPAPEPEPGLTVEGNLRRATVGMAAGTTLSRVSGVARVLALAYALGPTRLADGYNLANTIPNMLYDVVLGGVLSATFIPVFVDRLATRREREAWRSISAVLTLSLVVLLVATVVFWVATPLIIDAFTLLDHTHAAVGRNLTQEKAAATTLLRWFVPQIALYGVISLVTALLNTRRRFAAPTWVPIANNLVSVAVLLWFRAVAGPRPSLAGAQLHPNQLLLLGLGTTAGVAVQALLLLPSLRGIGMGRLRLRWDPSNEAVHTILRLGAWTFGFVVANQVALFVVLALAVGAPGADPVSSYTYAYTFLQMPYAVVAVSVMSAVTPALASRWAVSDVEGFRTRMSGGLRAVLAVILPAAVGMLLLARPAVALLLGHGSTTPAQTAPTGAALAMFALGLPGFCVYLYVVRVLQTMQRTEVAFWLYLVENGLNVVLAVVLVHPLGIRGLALSLSVAYTVAAVCGLVVLRRWLGHLAAPGAWRPLRRVGVATMVMGLLVLVVSNLSSANQGFGLLLRVLAAIVVGIVAYGGLAALLASRAAGRPAAHDPGRVRPVTSSLAGSAPRHVQPRHVRALPRDPVRTIARDLGEGWAEDGVDDGARRLLARHLEASSSWEPATTPHVVLLPLRRPTGPTPPYDRDNEGAGDRTGDQEAPPTAPPMAEPDHFEQANEDDLLEVGERRLIARHREGRAPGGEHPPEPPPVSNDLRPRRLWPPAPPRPGGRSSH